MELKMEMRQALTPAGVAGFPVLALAPMELKMEMRQALTPAGVARKSKSLHLGLAGSCVILAPQECSGMLRTILLSIDGHAMGKIMVLVLHVLKQYVQMELSIRQRVL